MTPAAPGLLLVFLGGGLGAMARYGVTLAADRWLAHPPSHGQPPGFPWATLAVNLLGCLCIGLLAAPLSTRTALRLAIITGLLGGFTTFSAFGIETARLLAHGRFALAALYVLVTNLAGLGAAAAAHRLMSPAPSPAPPTHTSTPTSSPSAT